MNSSLIPTYKDSHLSGKTLHLVRSGQKLYKGIEFNEGKESGQESTPLLAIQAMHYGEVRKRGQN